MTGILRKGWAAGTCALLILVALVWTSADVHALATTNLRQLTRGLLWNGFRNEGTQGGIYALTASRSACRNTYPGMACGMMLNMAGPDFIEYYGIKAGYSWQDQKQESQNTSAGESVVVLTRAPDGEYSASNSGLFNPTEDIVPMWYDIANSPEKDWGYDVKAPDHAKAPGLSMANWYPGASPATVGAEAGQPYEIMNFRTASYMDADKDDRPENIVFSKWTTKHGITVTRKAYSWSYQGFDDFFILEVEFENTGDSDGDGVADLNGGAGYQLDDSYFSFINGFTISQGAPYQNQGMPSDRGGTRPNDDEYRYTGDPDYDGPGEYAALKLSYQYDGDSPDTFDNDIGEPIKTTDPYYNQPGGFLEGQLLSYQYMGMAPLAYQDAGTSHVFNANDQGKYVNPTGDQPAAPVVWETIEIRRSNTNAPYASTHSDQQIYEAYTTPAAGNPAKAGAWVSGQTYGPYDLAVGDKAKIVMVYAGGTGANAVARSSDQPKYSMDMMAWARTGVPLEESNRLSRLAKGLGALADHVKAAQFTYDNAYDIPDYPPDVNFAVASNANALNEVAWTNAVESAVNPDDGVADIAGYRVFRSTWHEHGPWELMADVKAGVDGATWVYSGTEYRWEDLAAIPGFRYFYNVRAYASPKSAWTNGTATIDDLPDEVQDHLSVGLEGGYSAPEQRTNLSSSPYMPQNDDADAIDRKSVV